MKKNAYSHEEFIRRVTGINPHIKIVGEYTGVENKIEIECSHLGKNSVYAYSLLKRRNCCRKGYFENRVIPNKKTIEERKLEIQSIFGSSIDVSNIEYDPSTRGKIINLVCNEHGKFDQWIQALSLNIGCPMCGLLRARPNRVKQAKEMGKKAFARGKAMFVSKAETKWLDDLNVPIRQHWLEDVKYSVDGFDPATNTVYLYHGRFWHGCPETYDPEDVHPILKVKMKQLYEQTLSWEQRIKEAGYNLIIKWGK